MRNSLALSGEHYIGETSGGSKLESQPGHTGTARLHKHPREGETLATQAVLSFISTQENGKTLATHAGLGFISTQENGKTLANRQG